MLNFSIIAKDHNSKARAGFFETAHGIVETPAFMPVGTQGTVKAVNQDYLKKDINAQIILSNTYHLYLRPGTEILEKAGGLHKYMNWQKPILPDSGGYQVYSLAGEGLSRQLVRVADHPDRGDGVDAEVAADDQRLVLVVADDAEAQVAGVLRQLVLELRAERADVGRKVKEKGQ